MWGKRIRNLEKRIEALEQVANIEVIEITKIPGITGRVIHKHDVSTIVSLILEHLGLKIIYVPPVRKDGHARLEHYIKT